MINNYNLRGEIMLRKIAIGVLFGVLYCSGLNAVEYDGEKSYMLEVKYDICMIAPAEKEAMAQGIKIIGAKEAKKLYDHKGYFYDAREQRHYQKQHIKGARTILFDRSKAEYMAIDLPKDKSEALVFYCYGDSCASSYEAAVAVKKLGYKNVYWMINGFGEWKAKNYPVQ